MRSIPERYARYMADERDEDTVDDDSGPDVDAGRDADAERLEARNAEARDSMVARAHRKHGLAGAIVAGGMLAIDQVLGRRPKEQPAAVSEFSGEPTDIDKDGIQIPLDENTTVVSPAPHLRPGNKRVVRRRRRA
ncbi:MAG: hypothetical protein RL743_1461 [Actinomycetota bacterium]